MISGRMVRVLGVLSIALAVSGCQSLDDGWMGAMSEMGLTSTDEQQPSAEEPAQAAEEAAPATTMATEDGSEIWCAQVAAEDRDKAASEGYDAPSVERRYAVSYRQCLGVTAAAPAP